MGVGAGFAGGFGAGGVAGGGPGLVVVLVDELELLFALGGAPVFVPDFVAPVLVFAPVLEATVVP
jgi:hypothetical protein